MIAYISRQAQIKIGNMSGDLIKMIEAYFKVCYNLKLNYNEINLLFLK